MIPCYDACLYLLQHYILSDSIISQSLIDECENCIRYYANMYIFIVLLNRSQQTNPLVKTIQHLVDHTHAFFFGLLSSFSNQLAVFELRKREFERDGKDTTEITSVYLIDKVLM